MLLTPTVSRHVLTLSAERGGGAALRVAAILQVLCSFW